jgi:hypothetical protein
MLEAVFNKAVLSLNKTPLLKHQNRIFKCLSVSIFIFFPDKWQFSNPQPGFLRFYF